MTPTYDPSPYSVIGVKGTMVAVKIGREIKAQDLSQCKVLKYTREKEYDVLYWAKMALVMPKHYKERTTLDVYPDSPSKDSPPSLPEMEVVQHVGDPHQTDDHVQSGLRRSVGVRTSTWNTLYRDFVPS